MGKKTFYDEYYSNDFLELGRIGNVVSMRNNLSKKDFDNRNQLLAEQYDSKKLEIDNEIKNIVANIRKCDPLSLLLVATDRAMMNMVNTFSEIQIQGQKNFELRAIEYIQSILASTKSEFEEEDKQEILIEKVLNEISDLYIKIQMFYVFWGAKAYEKEKLLSERDITYIVEAQFMGNVRGKRYQFQQLTNMEKLLFPHSEKMQEVYGVSAEELLVGLKKLEYSLSGAKLDSIKEMFSEFLQFQQDSEGKSPEEVEKLFEEIRENERSIESRAKCFGTDLYNVQKVTGWNNKLIDSLSWQLGECEDFWNDGEFAGWPIVDLPVQKRPFIKIGGISYCFDYYNLFDNIYRIIQKDIKRHDSHYVTKWADLQQIASETLVEELFKRLLPGCQSYLGNYYPIGKSLKQMDENDILILYDDTLIIAEVKAGSFTYTPAITDYIAHKKSFDALVGKADYQCERTLNYIKNNQDAVFYSNSRSREQKVVIDKKKYKNIYTMCVTVDNFNAFEAKIEKTNFFEISNGTIAISIDDLEVYTEYFESPLYFLHYLKHRKLATNIKSLMLNDELDHLGMYIAHNAYDVYSNEFGECDSFVGYGYREDLDAYFASLYCEKLQYKKPEQNVPDKIKEIITFVEDENLPSRVSFSTFLLDLHPDTRMEFSDSVSYLYQRQLEVGRMFPVICNGDMMYGCFVIQEGILLTDEEHRLKYMYANMLKVNCEQSWYIVLTYTEDQKLKNVQYKELHLEDIDESGYDRNELLQISEMIYQNRVRTILEKRNRKKYILMTCALVGVEKILRNVVDKILVLNL